MAMLYGGQIQTMMPKLHSNNFEGMELIRPLYLIREEDIIRWAKHNQLEFIRCACRFTEQGEVTVGCNTSENPGYLTIFVSDTGNGIPEHRRNKLFTWFDAPDDMFDEAELDLSICQRLATKLGGLMEIDSQFGKGTRVLLILPLK
jgi:K+-sensing histidine kinase KdpD